MRSGGLMFLGICVGTRRPKIGRLEGALEHRPPLQNGDITKRHSNNSVKALPDTMSKASIFSIVSKTITKACAP